MYPRKCSAWGIPNTNQNNNPDEVTERWQTLQASCSAVPMPIFATKYSLESSWRDLQDLHAFAPLSRHYSSEIRHFPFLFENSKLQNIAFFLSNSVSDPYWNRYQLLNENAFGFLVLFLIHFFTWGFGRLRLFLQRKIRAQYKTFLLLGYSSPFELTVLYRSCSFPTSPVGPERAPVWACPLLKAFSDHTRHSTFDIRPNLGSRRPHNLR